jgi:predicted TIM-barrel fold metal-dependent hydrolase
VVIIDAWMQHPSAEFLADPVFDSLRRWASGRPIPYLDTVALEFPELVIVGGHIGYPWTAEMISLATKYPNVYIDTSAYKCRRYPAELVEYLRGHGRHKVLFGSNHPAWPAADCLRDLASLRLDEETTEAFLHATAERVFGLAAGAGPATQAATEGTQA